MTAADRSNVEQLIDYWKAKAEKSRNLSRRDGMSQFAVGFSSGMAAARTECIDELLKLMDIGDPEPGGADSLSYTGDILTPIHTNVYHLSSGEESESERTAKQRRWMRRHINTWRGRK